MTIRTYESLLENRPRKIYLGTKVGYLLPYFRREKSLQEISSETDIPELTLANWLRNDLSLIEEAIVKQEQALAEFADQVEPLAVPEGSNDLTVDQLLSNGARYQDAFLGYMNSVQLSEELGISLAVVRMHLDSLYGKVHGAYTEKSAILAQLIQRAGVTGGG